MNYFYDPTALSAAIKRKTFHALFRGTSCSDEKTSAILAYVTARNDFFVLEMNQLLDFRFDR
ncbi:hypothetical protein [Leptospira kobayashii]|uniref:hypothetical protein n=1 Tax=Leptospira kobayashii TaxID=1917830 RepID=UPI000D595BAE|nr:hypothetical protein [Leptospira kobayashii]